MYKQRLGDFCKSYTVKWLLPEYTKDYYKSWGKKNKQPNGRLGKGTGQFAEEENISP